MTDDLAGKEDNNHNARVIKTKQTNLSDTDWYYSGLELNLTNVRYIASDIYNLLP